MQHQIVDTVHILGLQNFDDCSRLNLLEVTIDSTSVIERLSNCKKYKFRFIIVSLKLSRSVQNDSEAIFITCDGLTEAKVHLSIRNYTKR